MTPWPHVAPNMKGKTRGNNSHLRLQHGAMFSRRHFRVIGFRLGVSAGRIRGRGHRTLVQHVINKLACAGFLLEVNLSLFLGEPPDAFLKAFRPARRFRPPPAFLGCPARGMFDCRSPGVVRWHAEILTRDTYVARYIRVFNLRQYWTNMWHVARVFN